jgi:hypothetical protein
MSKLRASTFCWAFSRALLIHGWMIASPSFKAELLQHGVHALGAEDAHQVVLQRQEELRVAGVALTAGTAAQLVVDAAAFVALGADHVEAAGVQRLLLQLFDLGADLRRWLPSRRALGHVGQFGSMRMSALPPSWMSVPRPAMLVAMVTAPGTPAWATI